MNSLASSPGPLAGIRIADFCWAWAGAHATTILALLGAEVIKIESRQRIDITRLNSLTTSQRFEGLDQSPVFNQVNLNKLSLSLNLARPQGVELARRLVRVSDVVAENMRPGAMERLGLDYTRLRAIKPDIIYLSSSALGATGPLREYSGYASNFAALSGLAHITGYPDGAPAEIRGEVDLFSAATAAFAILSALHHRQATGEGQHIDLSSTEVNAALCGDVFLDSQDGRSPARMGNGDELWAPHNCYRCRGDDQWLSLSVTTGQEWEALLKAMGDPDWAKEKRFADSTLRRQNEVELDRLIGAWTCQRTPYEGMLLLQRAGVAAFPSMTGKQLYEDQHLQERGAWQATYHKTLGRQVVQAPPWKLSETPATVNAGAPLFGEHNSYVLNELLGLSPWEIANLEKDRVVW
ncbi:MAG: CoA transferase [Chloroflexi bacterium]|nr:CoA transferase [Chloroflexota bacterium]